MEKKYKSLDGLRTYSALGIVLMHILSNMNLPLKGFIFTKLIPEFTNLVFLFMMVSSFSMCCGYYKKIKDKNIEIDKFYNKRYQRIAPYFLFVSTLELVNTPTKETLYELIANVTLCFGLLPNANIGVIGVGWFLGLIFVFYMLFPFYIFLIWNKKKAWFSFIITIILHKICVDYFFDINHVINFSPRSNIIYCSKFLLLGGIIYLYRESLEDIIKNNKKIICVITFVLLIFYFRNTIFDKEILMLVVFSCFLIISLEKNKILNNKFTEFIGNLSMEIYLCHMIIFRILEKLRIDKIIDNFVLNYIFISFLTILGSIIFSIIVKKILSVIWKRFK